MSMGSEGHHGTGHGGEEDGKVAEPNRVQPVAPAPRVNVLGLHEQGVEREMHVTVRRVVLAATSAGHFVLGDYNDRGDDRSALRIDRGPREGDLGKAYEETAAKCAGRRHSLPFEPRAPGHASLLRARTRGHSTKARSGKLSAHATRCQVTDSSRHIEGPTHGNDPHEGGSPRRRVERLLQGACSLSGHPSSPSSRRSTSLSSTSTSPGLSLRASTFSLRSTA